VRKVLQETPPEMDLGVSAADGGETQAVVIAMIDAISQPRRRSP
jgi:hypothetical protein